MDKIKKQQIDLYPIDNTYMNQSEMISNQADQTSNFIYYDGTSYWEYLGTTLGNINDYRQLGGSATNNEVKVIYIDPNDLSGIGTLEEQICEYVNDNIVIDYNKNYSKLNIVLSVPALTFISIRMTQSLTIENSSMELLGSKTSEEIKDAFVRSYFPQRGYSHPPLYFQDGDPIEVGSIIYMEDGQLSGITGKFIYSRNLPPTNGLPSLEADRPILIINVVDSEITEIIDFDDVVASPIYVTWGNIYNDYAIRDSRQITSSNDWIIPSVADWQTLQTYIGGSSEGGKLSIYGTNEFKFNDKLSGRREPWGAFAGFGISTSYFDDRLPNSAPNSGGVTFLSSTITIDNAGKGATGGRFVRLVKTSTILTHGQTGTYIGNNGIIYRTICIGTQEWLADNLIETQYRNSDIIPIVSDNATWQALTSGGMCYPFNDISTSYYIF